MPSLDWHTDVRPVLVAIYRALQQDTSANPKITTSD